MNTNPEIRPPIPPFNQETVAQKIRMAEDGWNSRDPERVSLAYTIDSQWRNRAEFTAGVARKSLNFRNANGRKSTNTA